MKKKLFLFDAYALIFRWYHAFKKSPRINSSGMNVNAVYGFVSTVLDIIHNYKPDYMAVVFDPPGGNFRKEIYPEYKANRQSTPEDIIKSLPMIQAFLEKAGIPSFMEMGYEADDVIGSIAKQSPDLEVYIVSEDKDLGQLVSEDCFLLKLTDKDNPKWDIEKICDKFRVRFPAQLIDFLALVGDKVDNIPGCKGIGEGKTIKLLQQYDSIDDIYSNIDKIEEKSIKKDLSNGREATFLSRDLATIRTDIPIATDLAKMAYKGDNEEGIVSALQQLEFPSLIARYYKAFAKKKSTKQKVIPRGLFDTEFTSDNDNTASADASDTYAHNPDQYQLIKSEEERAHLWQKIKESSLVAFDTETDGLDTFSCDIVGLSVALAPGEAYFMLLPEDASEVQRILRPLDEIMRDTRILKVAQNAKYDTEVLAKYGVSYPQPLFDTLIAHSLLYGDRPHSLDAIAKQFLNYNMMLYKELSDKKDFSLRKDVPIEKLCFYASEDADVTLQIYPLLQEKITENNQEKLFQEVEMPMVAVLKRIEERGIKVDINVLKTVGNELELEIDRLGEKIYQQAGKRFNINSPLQVGDILFDKLAIDPKAKKTKSGSFATNEKILQKYEPHFPIVADILEYRGANKLLNTYVRALPTYVATDGKIHASFNQAVTVTGRLSSSSPNLQNIPIRSDIGGKIRAAFVPCDSEHTLLSADYSQIELRLLAHMSAEPKMIDAFKRGVDIHLETAALINQIPPEKVTPQQRTFAKTANFGIIYGISPFGLSQRLRIPIGQAKEIIDKYFASFPGITDFIEKMIAKARECGYAETMLGRRNYLPDINSKNNTVRSFAERSAINTPIQGSAAELIKIAMIRIDERLRQENMKSRMTLQVHDELLFDAYLPELEALKSIVRYEMENALGTLRLPLEVSMGTGNNWLVAH